MKEIRSADDMMAEAAGFVAGLTPKTAATVVALIGDLGAGKTTFVKGAAQALGIEEHVTSPTFVIEKIYPIEGGAFTRLVHIDAYRLKGEHHLKVLGWEELTADPRALIFVEWPQQAGAAIPKDAISISFEYSDEDTRHITYG